MKIEKRAIKKIPLREVEFGQVFSFDDGDLPVFIMTDEDNVIVDLDTGKAYDIGIGECYNWDEEVVVFKNAKVVLD